MSNGAGGTSNLDNFVDTCTYRCGHCKMPELQINKFVDLVFYTDHDDIWYLAYIKESTKSNPSQINVIWA